MKEAWDLFLHGGFVMWPLLVALIITVAIAIERIASVSYTHLIKIS